MRETLSYPYTSVVSSTSMPWSGMSTLLLDEVVPSSSQATKSKHMKEGRPLSLFPMSIQSLLHYCIAGSLLQAGVESKARVKQGQQINLLKVKHKA